MIFSSLLLLAIGWGITGASKSTQVSSTRVENPFKGKVFLPIGQKTTQSSTVVLTSTRRVLTTCYSTAAMAVACMGRRKRAMQIESIEDFDLSGDFDLDSSAVDDEQLETSGGTREDKSIRLVNFAFTTLTVTTNSFVPGTSITVTAACTIPGTLTAETCTFIDFG